MKWFYSFFDFLRKKEKSFLKIDWYWKYKLIHCKGFSYSINFYVPSCHLLFSLLFASVRRSNTKKSRNDHETTAEAVVSVFIKYADIQDFVSIQRKWQGQNVESMSFVSIFNLLFSNTFNSYWKSNVKFVLKPYYSKKI